METPPAQAAPRREPILPAKLQPYPRLVAVAILFCLALALYLPTVRHSFLNYDDNEYVAENSHVRTGLTLASVKWAFTNIDIGHWEPITWLTHLADCSLFGLYPGGHHLASALLHAINTCFLFLLLYWITAAYGRSLLVAALFAVHPLNVEVVAWIAERKTLVCTFFTFATFGAYVWYAARPRLERYALVLVAFLLAVMSKSMAVTVPLLLLLVDYWALGRWEYDPVPAVLPVPRQSTARLLLEKIPLLAISGLISLLTLHAQEKGKAVSHDPFVGRIAHAIWSYAAYILKLIWPAQLSILYPYDAHGHPLWQVILAMVGLLAITVAVMRARSKPYLAFGWFFYLIAMLPVIGIVRVGPQSLSDHYLYVPAIGLFLLAVWGAHDLLQQARVVTTAASLGLGTAVVLACAIATAFYLPNWQDSLTLFARAERLSPIPNDLIENNLAEALRDTGQPLEAIPHYRQAIALAPQMPLPHCNLGSVLVALGDPFSGLAEIQKGLDDSPSDAIKVQCLNNLGVVRMVMSQNDLAEQSFSAALRIDPDFEHSLVGRGMLRYRAGEVDGALADLRRAVANASDPVAYYWLGKTLAAKGEREAAITAFQHSLALSPGRPEVQFEIDRLHQGAAPGPARPAN